MLWLQSGACFLLWIGFGLLLWKRLSATPPTAMKHRAALGPLLLIAGVGVLAGVFALTNSLGLLQQDRLTPLGWLFMAIGGVLFVACQSLGAYWMLAAVQREVTSGRRPTSTDQDSEVQP